MKEILLVQNLRLVYEPHWIGFGDSGVDYDHFEIGASHEIEAKYLPRELYVELRKFIQNVEQAHDRAGEASEEEVTHDIASPEVGRVR